MPRDPQHRLQFANPELFLSELLRDSARGFLRQKDEYTPFLKRAIVVAVDVQGGRLENPTGDGKLTHFIDGKNVEMPATVGPSNPRNSVKARVITEASDQFKGDNDLVVFWPLMPEHFSVPIKPGEHVYVVYEDENESHGLWWSKVPGHEGINFFRGEDSFVTSEGSLGDKFDDSKTATDAEAGGLDTDHAASEAVPSAQRLTPLFEE